MPFPVFVAHSDVDPVFAYADVVADYDELPEPKYLLTLHGAGHATVGEDTVTAADEMYRQATTAFWDRTLRGDVTAPFPESIEGVATLVAGARPDVLPGHPLTAAVRSPARSTPSAAATSAEAGVELGRADRHGHHDPRRAGRRVGGDEVGQARRGRRGSAGRPGS